jgi:hypothetical protein
LYLRYDSSTFEAKNSAATPITKRSCCLKL